MRILTNESEIDAITDKLMVLALDGDKEAAQYFADLSVARRNWERMRSAESWRELIREAQRVRAWVDR
jgi:hypothetical protein